jgi:hypothetical protein
MADILDLTEKLAEKAKTEVDEIVGEITADMVDELVAEFEAGFEAEFGKSVVTFKKDVLFIDDLECGIEYDLTYSMGIGGLMKEENISMDSINLLVNGYALHMKGKISLYSLCDLFLEKTGLEIMLFNSVKNMMYLRKAECGSCFYVTFPVISYDSEG